MKKIIFSVIALTIISVKAHAQYEYYPSLFGRLTINGGSARYMAIGGAATSLGADLGSAYVNPAGLGMYRKSEMSLTPTFGFSGSNTTFLDESEKNRKGSFGLNNFGIALCNNKDVLDDSPWRGGTFSIAMNKTNTFHNRIGFTSLDDNNSMADYFVQQASGISADDYDTYSDPNDPNGDGITDLGGLAYYTYLIEPYGATNSDYFHGMQDETVLKEASYRTRGNQTQWNLSYGSNYKDKLFLGGGLGITGINFKEDLTYTETVGYKINDEFTSSPDTIDYFTFNDYNTIKGTGLNFKLGYIYKPIEAIRFGTTITTPTFYWMNQQYSSDLTVQYAANYTYFGYNLDIQSQSTTPGTYRFYYTAPLRLSQGLSFFIGKSGFISADAELVPYNLSSLQSRTPDDNSLKNYDKFIVNTYKNIINLRAGGEIRFDIIKLRAGFAYLPNPYNYSDNINRNISQISGGIGLRLEDIYFDIGVVNSRFESSYKPYSLTNESTTAARAKNSILNVAFTMGFYFE